jgi:hypothetical protein
LQFQKHEELYLAEYLLPLSFLLDYGFFFIEVLSLGSERTKQE